MKVGDIVERDGTKRLVTNVYTLCGSIAYDSVPAEDAKVKKPVENRLTMFRQMKR